MLLIIILSQLLLHIEWSCVDYSVIYITVKYSIKAITLGSS